VYGRFCASSLISIAHVLVSSYAVYCTIRTNLSRHLTASQEDTTSPHTARSCIAILNNILSDDGVSNIQVSFARVIEVAKVLG
jgi:hypothetical protein